MVCQSGHIPGDGIVQLRVSVHAILLVGGEVVDSSVSELVPREKLAEMNGRAFAFLSLGWMSGAPFCWLLIETFGNYRPLYAVVMALNFSIALLLGIWMLTRRR